jgi:DNA relaxase NicK
MTPSAAVRFDGYTATTTEANHYQLADLFGPGLQVREGHGFHQFGHRLSMRDDVGEVGSVQWGGGQGTRTMIEVKGERSPEVVERLRARFPHRCTRMDACADFDAPGAFERVLAVCMRVKRAHRLKGERQGDWEDFPEQGRTQYLGARSSVTRLRLYEKGKQPEYLHLSRPDWVRAEVQVRPAKDAKSTYSQLSPVDAWGSAAWSRELAGEILADHVHPHPAGYTWRKTDLERRLDWVCRQAGPTLVELRDLVGNWECVGLTLGERIKELLSKTAQE